MSDRSKQRWYKVAIAVLVGSILCLLANISLVMFVRYHHFGLLPIQPQPNTEALGLKVGEQPDELIVSDDLLVESIIAIIQSYYVDATRVQFAQLLRSTLENLAIHPDIDYLRSGNKTSLSIHGEHLRLNFSANLGFRGLITNLILVTSFIEQLNEKKNISDQPDAIAIVLNALLSSLDAHSALLSTNEYRELRQGTDGAFGGLGVLVGIRDHLLTVIKPMPHSPASRAGLRKYDRILRIDNLNTYGYPLDELVDYMRGKPGSQVRIRVLRDGDPSPMTVSIQREIIKVKTVESEVISKSVHNFLHLKIDSFAARTAVEVREALRNFRTKTDDHLDGVVLDLRSNPGGLLEQAIQVADVFLPSGVIVSTIGRRQEVESADRNNDELDYPIVILIDGDSASASEIVAGALQDHGRAIVIGQPSFGKGSVQTIFELPGERALKLTTARYYTPLGRSIQNVGIYPDVWIQPVSKKDTNSNLLGSYRYRNERFLRNHLDSEIDFDPSRQKGFKGYYLRDDINYSIFDSPFKKNEEYTLALEVLTKIANTYGAKLHEAVRRSSHWLALASVVIKSRLRQSNQTTEKWLQDKHDLRWGSQQTGILRGKDIALKVLLPPVVQAVPGERLEIPWEVRNLGQADLSRLSVFVSSSDVGIETHERLVGVLEHDHVSNGSMLISVPYIAEQSYFTLHIGLAKDAIPLVDHSIKRVVKLSSKVFASLTTDVSLVDEKGGRVDGLIEKNELAQLKVVVNNNGPVEIRSLSARVLNLSGHQLKIDEKVQRTKVVGSYDAHVFLMTLRGGEEIYTKSLDIGVAIDSPDLAEPIRKSVEVSAIPSSGEPGVVSAVGH